MLKFGVVSEINASKGLARVYFEEDDFVSGWLKIGVPRSFGDQFSFPFNVNEHVYCIMDEDWEYGVIAGAVYDENNLPKGSDVGLLQWCFRDDSVISYNTNERTLSIDIKGDVKIVCKNANIKASGDLKVDAGSISLTAPMTNIIGALNVKGAATITGVIAMGGLSGISGLPVDGGDSEIKVSMLTATSDVVAGNISLKNHTHTSSASGSPTSNPLP